MSNAPWYLKIIRRNLKHQRKWKSDPNYTKSWLNSTRREHVKRNDQISDGVMISQDSYIHSSKLCRAIMHTTKLCMERPRKKEARWANMHIAPDEKIESYELDYDGKRDRWNGFDASTYAREISEDNEDDDVLKVDEAKVDESKQMDFVKVKKRVCMMLNCNLVLAQNNGSSPF
ncbi:hypothetical protein DVH24_001857 [Malus domestica]|uniref:Pre-mRNA-splicing factor SLU7 n=1 Tax=Malus domestica TaxID=3750 RepID=A0A498I616_MALDO|nr:hypothetical protein DVH24_001857 [Malus domestica]